MASKYCIVSDRIVWLTWTVNETICTHKFCRLYRKCSSRATIIWLWQRFLCVSPWSLMHIHIDCRMFKPVEFHNVIYIVRQHDMADKASEHLYISPERRANTTTPWAEIRGRKQYHTTNKIRKIRDMRRNHISNHYHFGTLISCSSQWFSKDLFDFNLRPFFLSYIFRGDNENEIHAYFVESKMLIWTWKRRSKKLSQRKCDSRIECKIKINSKMYYSVRCSLLWK